MTKPITTHDRSSIGRPLSHQVVSSSTYQGLSRLMTSFCSASSFMCLTSPRLVKVFNLSCARLRSCGLAYSGYNFATSLLCHISFAWLYRFKGTSSAQSCPEMYPPRNLSGLDIGSGPFSWVVGRILTASTSPRFRCIFPAFPSLRSSLHAPSRESKPKRAYMYEDNTWIM
ncbi:hypothetical protein GE21DRAFT_1006815 [Neurospora crassa]|nr:hypothetical protein GE21DRAFT_1006815 [Neurospora crassa]